MRVMLVGVGGTGNAVLAALDPSLLECLTLVDPDWVEVSNLNRQFWFGEEDVGVNKAEVAGRRVLENLKGVCKVTWMACAIAQISDQCLFSHDTFVIATDNLESRLCVNSRLWEGWNARKRGRFRLIDTGSNRMRGHVFFTDGEDRNSACLACIAELYVPDTLALPDHCSISHKLASFDDCIRRVLLVQKDFSAVGAKFIHCSAVELATEAGIQARDEQYTSDFVRGFSVNFSATNAVVAGVACRVLEALEPLKANYVTINCDFGVQIESFRLQRAEKCTVCLPNNQNIVALQAFKTLEASFRILSVPFNVRWALFSEEGALCCDSNRLPDGNLPSLTWQDVLSPEHLNQTLTLQAKGVPHTLQIRVAQPDS